ncbi:MAG: hypothetical protein WBW33_26490 [Bryobacteraceae bacterium]
MDERIRQLLDKIPERPPRSKLEQHSEVIRELRRKRRTYQEIAVFFREHLQISVAPSTVHDFVKKRAKQARIRPAQMPKSPPESSLGATPMQVPATSDAVPPRSTKGARDTIQAVRAQPVATSREPSLFEFELESPLTSDPKAKEK